MSDSDETSGIVRKGFVDGLIDGMVVPKSKRTMRHWIVSIVGGFAFGIGSVVMVRLLFGERAIVDGIDAIGGLTAFFGLALVTVMLWVGLWVLFIGMSRRAMQRAMDLDGGEPAPAMMANFRLSALGLACQAGLILLIVFDGMAAPVAIAIAAVLLIAEQWLGWRIYARSDELWQRATLESCALHSALVSLLLGGWAVLHSYAVLPPISPLAMLATLLLSGVVTTVYAVHRRGVLD